MRTRCDAGRLRQDQRAGKTTLIDIVASKIRPCGGEVRFLGQRITWKQAHQVARLGIARTSQIAQPFVGMTALDVATIGALFGRAGGTHRLSAARRDAQAALVRLGLGSHRDKAADSLNIVDPKRVELARTLAIIPMLLCERRRVSVACRPVALSGAASCDAAR